MFVDRFFKLLFSPDDGSGSAPPHGVEGDVELMNQGDTDSEEGESTEETSETESESEQESSVEEFGEEGEEDTETPEEGEEGEGEEKPDTQPFEGRPTLTDIKTKYPKIFKEFPDLREVLFREQKFSEYFGSVDEAQEAAAKVSNFNTIEAALLGGDSTPIIDQLAANAPESLNQVVDNFLPALLNKSQDLYLRATTPVIEQFLHSAYEYGKRVGDANLMKSAQHAANFIFGKPDIPDPSRRGRSGPHPAETQLEEERKGWAQTRFTEASQEVSGEVDTVLEAEILKGLDPDKKMSERQRTRLIQDIKDAIDAQLGKDEAFKRQMRGMWQRASTSSYSREQRASITNAFLARAKPLVPAIRSRLKAEWFGKAPKQLGQIPPRSETTGQFVKKRTFPQSGSPSQGGRTRPPSPREVDYSRTSDMDLIEGKFTRRK